MLKTNIYQNYSLLFFLIFTIMGLCLNLKCNAVIPQETDSIVHGNFSIAKQVHQEKRSFYNRLRNSKDETHSYSLSYEVLYKGNKVPFNKAMFADKENPFLWRVWNLKGNSNNAILVAGTEIVLLSESNNKLQTLTFEKEDATDYCTLQFLDDNLTLPGKQTILTGPLNDTAKPKLELEGEGRYLLINHLTLLDIKTLEIIRLNIPQQKLKDLGMRLLLDPDLENKQVAIGFFPKFNEIVFRCYPLEAKEIMEEAYLAVVNYKTGEISMLNVSNNNYHLTSSGDISSEWVARYCVRNSSNSLVIQKDKKKEVWPGKVEIFEDRNSSYTLYPVKPSMCTKFLHYLKTIFSGEKDFSISEQKANADNSRVFWEISIKGEKYIAEYFTDKWSYGDKRKLIFRNSDFFSSAKKDLYKSIIEHIGNFNAEMNAKDYTNDFY